ncbi:pupal cuticle protein C1B-like [Venturia canescens]|uniref:pupal cuticle protein C1B-like n=1 Tax=Venturia canescens TaxID=32260 RepID=UPI001C9C7DD3|nr:pupal cuticle protein C1B-like [Venturia canescens]
MKCFVAIAVLAIVAVALADSKPVEAEAIEPVKVEAAVAPEAARDKRGLLLGAYTAPVAYSAYTAPLAYSAAYSYPYAYSAYSAYPYYAAGYNSAYYLA